MLVDCGALNFFTAGGIPTVVKILSHNLRNSGSVSLIRLNKLITTTKDQHGVLVGIFFLDEAVDGTGKMNDVLK